MAARVRGFGPGAPDLRLQVDDFGGGGWGFQVQPGEGDGEREAAGTAASGIEIKDVVAVLDERLMGVAVDDDGDSGCTGVEVEVVDGVEHVDEAAVELDGFGCREIGAGAVEIDVAANGGDGSDRAESVKDVGVADVAGVEDVVGTGDGGEELGTEQAVGVGEDSDLHG